MQKLEELIAALENATRPDRELDADILEATAGCAHRETEYYCIEDGNDIDSGFTCKRCHKDTYGERVPAFTSSVDVALALMERLEPRFDWAFSKTGAHISAGVDIFSGRAHTPALALLIATLRAKLSQEINNAE